jgi:hypothetical protein
MKVAIEELSKVEIITKEAKVAELTKNSVSSVLPE